MAQDEDCYPVCIADENVVNGQINERVMNEQINESVINEQINSTIKTTQTKFQRCTQGS